MWSLSVEADDGENARLREKSNISSSGKEGDNKLPVFKKPRPKLKPPTALEKIFGKNSKWKVKHNFTAGVKINESNKRDIHVEISPFKYPEDLEEFSYKVMTKAWRDTARIKANNLKYNQRHSHRTRQNIDLLNRLYVKEPVVQDMKTIIDLDPDFFTMVQSRPVPQVFNRRNYIDDVRETLRHKIAVGYREDEIMLIDENFLIEQKIIDEIKEQFQKYILSFEDFLYKDHTLSMSLLQESEQLARVAAQKYDVFKNLSKEFGLTKSVVYTLEEKWRHCKMYQKFLYLMSPMEWRIEHDYFKNKKEFLDENKSIDDLEEEESSPDDSNISIFARYKLGATGYILSLENLIDQFLDDVKLQEDPLLYFESPPELLKVFEFMEIQNLNSLLHSEELAVPLESVKDGMDKIHNKFDIEMAALQDIIDNLEGGIIWEEQRAKYLEELALELIYGDFKKLITDTDVVNLYVFVENIYESRIGVNDSNLGMGEMMKLIEMLFREFLVQLDRLPSELVSQAEKQCYRDEARAMKLAIDAAKQLLQIERLIKHLAKLLEPPIYHFSRGLVWRSTLKNTTVKPPTPPKTLSQDEKDYLTYFVDFCVDTDDPKVYGFLN